MAKAWFSLCSSLFLLLEIVDATKYNNKNEIKLIKEHTNKNKNEIYKKVTRNI